MNAIENTNHTRLGLSVIGGVVIAFAALKVSSYLPGHEYAKQHAILFVCWLVAALLIASASRYLVEPPGRPTRIAIPVVLTLPAWLTGSVFLDQSYAIGDVWFEQSWYPLGVMLFFGFATGWAWNRHRRADACRGLTTSWNALFASFPVAIVGTATVWHWSQELAARFVFLTLGFALAFAFVRTTPRTPRAA